MQDLLIDYPNIKNRKQAACADRVPMLDLLLPMLLLLLLLIIYIIIIYYLAS